MAGILKFIYSENLISYDFPKFSEKVSKFSEGFSVSKQTFLLKLKILKMRNSLLWQV